MGAECLPELSQLNDRIFLRALLLNQLSLESKLRNSSIPKWRQDCGDCLDMPLIYWTVLNSGTKRIDAN
jgi:hypothetical protein